MVLEYTKIKGKYDKPMRERINLDRERQAQRKRKRNHKKRHSENRERAILAKQKAALHKHNTIVRKENWQKLKALIKKYWSGEIETYPLKEG